MIDTGVLSLSWRQNTHAPGRFRGSRQIEASRQEMFRGKGDATIPHTMFVH